MTHALAQPLAMLFYGGAAHLLSCLAEASAKQGSRVTPLAYIRNRPYRVALGLIGSLAGYGALSSTGQLTAVAAFGVGYMADNALSKIADAASNRFSP